MKSKIVFSLLFISAFATTTFSQSVVFKRDKKIYKRTGNDVPDFKKEFEVNYPVITSRLNTTIKKSLQNTISYWRVFDISLKDNLRDDHWLTNLNYSINYNQNFILSILLTADGLGAYPDSSEKYFVINLRTGKQVGIDDVFKQNSLAFLLSKIRKEIRKRENATRLANSCFAETIDFQRESDIAKKYFPKPEKIKFKDLSGFFVTEKGTTFVYDYRFAHVVKACEPESKYFFSWAKLKLFIRREGLLGKFVR